MFEFDGEGLYAPIEAVIEIDDLEVERNADLYKSNDATRETIDQYREKKADVIARRDVLRREVGSTTDSLRNADTDAEVKKLTGILIGLQTELQATDQELEIAKGDSEARALENENQANADAKAKAEAEARRFQEANRRDVETYQLDQSPYGW